MRIFQYFSCRAYKTDDKSLILCMAKKKRQGHYCRICGEYKANEKFSGKGHAQHICKACMSKKNKVVEIDPDIQVVDEYYDDELFGDMEYDMFNPDIDIMPPVEPERKKYKKLCKEEKDALKIMWTDIITGYWLDERQIPFGESFNRLRKQLIDIFIEQGNLEIIDDHDLKVVLNDCMVSTINKLLKSEKNRRQ